MKNLALVLVAATLLISSYSKAESLEVVCSRESAKDCVLYSINQIPKCEHYTTPSGNALSRWCVDNATDTAIKVISTLAGQQGLASIEVLERIKNCRYYPSINSRPYTSDCVSQLVDIASGMIH